MASTRNNKFVEFAVQVNVSEVGMEMYRDLLNFQRLGKRFGNVAAYATSAETIHRMRQFVECLYYCFRTHESVTAAANAHVQLLSWESVKTFRDQCTALLDKQNVSWDKSTMKIIKQEVRSLYRATQRLYDSSVDALKHVTAISTVLQDFSRASFSIASLQPVCERVAGLFEQSGGDRGSLADQVWRNVIDGALLAIAIYKVYVSLICFRRILEEDSSTAVEEEGLSEPRLSFSEVISRLGQSSSQQDVLISSLLQYSGVTEDAFWTHTNLAPKTVNLRFFADENGLTLKPSVQLLRQKISRDLDDLVGTFYSIPSPNKSGGEHSNLVEQCLTSETMLSLYKDLQNLIQLAFASGEDFVKYVRGYVDMWLPYKALWDLDAPTVESIMGSSLDRWRQVLGELNKLGKAWTLPRTCKALVCTRAGTNGKPLLP